MGTRHRADRGAKRRWAARLAAFHAALRRTWHETPGYVLVKAVKDLFKRD
jgi:hypothetical protein